MSISKYNLVVARLSRCVQLAPTATHASHWLLVLIPVLTLLALPATLSTPCFAAQSSTDVALPPLPARVVAARHIGPHDDAPQEASPSNPPASAPLTPGEEQNLNYPHAVPSEPAEVEPPTLPAVISKVASNPSATTTAQQASDSTTAAIVTNPAASTALPPAAIDAAPRRTAMSTPARPRSSDANKPLGTASPTKLTVASSDPQAPAANKTGSATASASLIRTLLALSGVIVLILLLGLGVRWLARFSGSSSALGIALGARGTAPSGLLEVLGRYPLCRGSMLIVLKFDRRVLLINQSRSRGGTTMQTLSELTDVSEVAAILAKVRGETKSSALAPESSPISAAESRSTFASKLGANITRQVSDVVVTPLAPSATVAKHSANSPARDLLPANIDGASAARSLRARLAALQSRTSSPARVEQPEVVRTIQVSVLPPGLAA